MLPQTPALLIDIANWSVDEDFAIFPVGSKPKRLVRCPDNAPQPFLAGAHSYLFKVAHGWLAQQLWSEVIASRIAATVGVDVPPCFVAIDSQAGDVGALVEFFYGHPRDAKPARFIPAADLLQRLRTGPRNDRPHFVRLNLHPLPPPWIDGGDRMVGARPMFRCTDRKHRSSPRELGTLRRIREERNTSWALAPAFDNGTSLGYEIREEKLSDFRDALKKAENATVGRTKLLIFRNLESAARNSSVFP